MECCENRIQSWESGSIRVYLHTFSSPMQSPRVYVAVTKEEYVDIVFSLPAQSRAHSRPRRKSESETRRDRHAVFLPRESGS